MHAAATGSVEDRPAASTSVSASRAMVQTSPPAFSPLASRKELSPRGRDAAAAAATNPRAESPTMSLAKLAETLNGTFNINAVAFIAVQLVSPRAWRVPFPPPLLSPSLSLSLSLSIHLCISIYLSLHLCA